MSLVGKIAVVTGGASGIGLATSQRLAREGAAVAIYDVDEAASQRAAAELVAKGVRAIACRVDVSKRAQIDAGLERVRAELGPVEILVTNAGITSFTPFQETTAELWHRVMSINLKSVLLCTQAVLPDMLAA